MLFEKANFLIALSFLTHIIEFMKQLLLSILSVIIAFTAIRPVTADGSETPVKYEALTTSPLLSFDFIHLPSKKNVTVPVIAGTTLNKLSVERPDFFDFVQDDFYYLPIYRYLREKEYFLLI
jgi:hypothetical protein